MTMTFLKKPAKLITALALAGLIGLAGNLHAQKKSVPAPKAATPKAASPTAAGHSTAGAGHTTTGTTAGAGHTTTAAAGRGGTAAGARGASAASASTVHTKSGGDLTRGPGNKPASYKAANGNTAKFNSKGQVHEVRAGNTTITHGPGGAKRIVAEGPNHTRYVADAHGHGYVQRPYMYHGHAYQGRTYYRNGVVYHEYYRPYYYNGVYLSGYYPATFYSPAFYGWAYAPWGAPVAYQWGWGGAPWYGAYGPYFAPYPVYATASLWLTDYLIANSLQQAYAAGVQAGAAGVAANRPSRELQGGAHLMLASYSPSGASMGAPAASGAGVALTPEIKKAISDEVTLTLNEEKAEAAQTGGADAAPHGVDQLMTDGKSHVFVASDPIDISTEEGQDCSLTAGDVVQMNASPTAKDNAYAVQVLASKANDCRKGATVDVSLENLQDMHNSLMATVDQGLGDLQKKAGQGGLPAAPAGSTTATAAPYAAAAPADDPNGAQELAKVAAEGNQADQQVVNEAAGASSESQGGAAETAASVSATPSSSGPVTIALGQTPAQVMAAKGQPKQIINLGAKQIYVYSDIKIYFVGGKVTDVQ